MAETNNLNIREATSADFDELLAIEQQCFASDRLSRRSFKHHLQSEHSVLIVADRPQANKPSMLAGYALCLLHKGTRLARLYSLAVLPTMQGMSVGKRLLEESEQIAAANGRLFMRIEVAESNQSAINLYKRQGYRVFGEYHDYYDDHQDALRMQKTVRHAPADLQTLRANWYQQTTDFTCGPASLMMAMSALEPTISCDQSLEIDLWRESTTVFMTSGVGGTHPFGLALAAQRRGIEAEVYINTRQTLFLEGVRTPTKKEIMALVHKQFFNECAQEGISINYQDATQNRLAQWLKESCAVIMLISTYRLDGKKAPHWVLVTGIDSECLYVHDPHRDERWQQAIDCQHVPIARQDFDRMASFGASRIRCAIVLKPKT